MRSHASSACLTLPGLADARPLRAEVMGRLDSLVDLVYDRYKDRYFKDEKVFVDIAGDKCVCSFFLPLPSGADGDAW